VRIDETNKARIGTNQLTMKTMTMRCTSQRQDHRSFRRDARAGVRVATALSMVVMLPLL
jgi:hypothetical protein